jgi:hypothetical protein
MYVAVRVSGEVVGVLEVAQRPNVSADAAQGMCQFLKVLAGILADWHRAIVPVRISPSAASAAPTRASDTLASDFASVEITADGICKLTIRATLREPLEIDRTLGLIITMLDQWEWQRPRTPGEIEFQIASHSNWFGEIRDKLVTLYDDPHLGSWLCDVPVHVTLRNVSGMIEHEFMLESPYVGAGKPWWQFW